MSPFPRYTENVENFEAALYFRLDRRRSGDTVADDLARRAFAQEVEQQMSNYLYERFGTYYVHAKMVDGMLKVVFSGNPKRRKEIEKAARTKMGELRKRGSSEYGELVDFYMSGGESPELAYDFTTGHYRNILSDRRGRRIRPDKGTPPELVEEAMKLAAKMSIGEQRASYSLRPRGATSYDVDKQDIQFVPENEKEPLDVELPVPAKELARRYRKTAKTTSYEGPNGSRIVEIHSPEKELSGVDMIFLKTGTAYALAEGEACELPHISEHKLMRDAQGRNMQTIYRKRGLWFHAMTEEDATSYVILGKGDNRKALFSAAIEQARRFGEEIDEGTLPVEKLSVATEEKTNEWCLSDASRAADAAVYGGDRTLKDQLAALNGISREDIKRWKGRYRAEDAVIVGFNQSREELEEIARNIPSRPGPRDETPILKKGRYFFESRKWGAIDSIERTVVPTEDAAAVLTYLRMAANGLDGLMENGLDLQIDSSTTGNMTAIDVTFDGAYTRREVHKLYKRWRRALAETLSGSSHKDWQEEFRSAKAGYFGGRNVSYENLTPRIEQLAARSAEREGTCTEYTRMLKLGYDEVVAAKKLYLSVPVRSQPVF